MGNDVFISHSHHNDEQANTIAAALEEANIRCWMDHRDIPDGSDWISEVLNGLESCAVMLIVVSAKGNERPGMLVRELQHAINHRIPILPIKVEEVEVERTLKFLIGTAQIMSALPPPFSKHSSRVVNSVKGKLKRPECGPGEVSTKSLVRKPKRHALRNYLLSLLSMVLLAVIIFSSTRFWRHQTPPIEIALTHPLTPASEQDSGRVDERIKEANAISQRAEGHHDSRVKLDLLEMVKDSWESIHKELGTNQSRDALKLATANWYTQLGVVDTEKAGVWDPSVPAPRWQGTS